VPTASIEQRRDSRSSNSHDKESRLQMNERIKNFYDQVGLDFENLQRVTVAKGDMEKFAELIVRECVAICQDIDGEDNIDARSGRQDCAVEIKEHFGIEE
jgi:hypothetical protein